MASRRPAIKVLQVWGRQEPEAVYYVERVLLVIQQRGSALPSRSGHAYCLEYRDIVRRYPYLTETGEGQELCPLTAAK